MQENAEQKTGKTDTAKFKKPLKFDFSFTNWGEATERWLKGVKKRYSTLFPDVSKQAHILAGIKVKATEADSESSSSESGSDSSGRDLDSEYEGHGNGRPGDNDHQNDADGNIDADIHQGNGDDIDCKKEGNCGHGHSGYQQTDNEANNEQEGDDNEEGLEYYASEELDEENGPRVHGSGNEGDNGNHGDDDGDGGLDNAGDGNEVQVVEEDDYEMLELEAHQPLALASESALSDISD